MHTRAKFPRTSQVTLRSPVVSYKWAWEKFRKKQDFSHLTQTWRQLFDQSHILQQRSVGNILRVFVAFWVEKILCNRRWYGQIRHVERKYGWKLITIPTEHSLFCSHLKAKIMLADFRKDISWSPFLIFINL